MSKINANNPVNALVASFQTSLPANLDKQADFQVRGYRVLWTQIAEAYAIAQRIIKNENKDDYNAALTERDIEVSKTKTANRYLPVVKLLYGEWKADDATVFEPNRSAEKYACVFRYLNKRNDQFPDTASIVAHIEATPGHLKKIEEIDRDDHKAKKNGAKASSEEALERGSSVLGGYPIERLSLIPSGADIGQLWFKMGKDGKPYILGYRKMEEKTFETEATKRGRVLLDESVSQMRQAEIERARAA